MAVEASLQRLHLGASPALLLWIFTVHGAMVIIFIVFFFVLQLSLLILLLLLLATGGVFVTNLCRYKRSCGCILAFAVEGWFLFDVLGRRSRIDFERALIWPGLVVLYFNGPVCQSSAIVITPDRVCPEELRRLRVFLRTSL